MRFSIFLLAITLSTISCNQTSNSAQTDSFTYGKTPLATLKERYRFQLADSRNYDAQYYYAKKNKDEILKTLEVIEEVEVKKDVALVFYRYSVGTDVVKETEYFRKLDGLYIPYYVYFSDYDDDPFKNGKPSEGKALLKKKEDWSNNEHIWWAF